MPRTDEHLLDRAKAMRTEMTPAEARLWYYFRAKRLRGFKFARQVVIGRYIVDFVARQESLIVELDGDTHAGRESYDADRTAWLRARGYRLIRVSNGDVMGNIEGVLQVILEAIHTSPLPGPLPGGEREIRMPLANLNQ